MIKRVNGRILHMADDEPNRQVRAKVLLEFHYQDGPRCSIVEGEVAMPRRAWGRARLERRLLKRAWAKLEAYFEGCERAEPNIFA